MSVAFAIQTPPAAAAPTRCTGCAHLPACQAAGYGRPELHGLRCIAERVGLLRDGEYLYRPLTPFHAVYAVQSGMAKTVSVDRAGRERVLAFHLPGELFGLDAIWQGQHDSAAVALGRTQCCRFPFAALRDLATRQPQVQAHLLCAMSRLVHRQHLDAAGGSADERMAAFLVDLHERRRALGDTGALLPLPMSRADIGNHLRLATETVSRLLARFRDAGLLRVTRSGVELLHLDGLRHVGWGEP
ncbi:CRP/FNR family transcriptional regulator [Dyella sp. SG562]|uniref:Crp/Fnr family transcriptional regulator n=1 Tax=Dyella sp. SG562 TaxID=2587017 RepID=UPI0014248154|nr:helix-turn-helix domain-containing protein [Dyella sp. SG562]NII74525.1 CRP/FNR family transcriptional regulator [Dyella sp. SG562]